MKVVILCGGKGTRISEVTQVIPKPMLLIGDKPILWHIMKIYAHHGLNEFVLCLGYKGWVIKEYFLNYYAKISDISVTLGKKDPIVYHGNCDEVDWTITLAETGEETQTGGRVWRVSRYLENDDLFCLTYGDGVANIDVGALLEKHRKSGLLATITGVHPSGRYGEITAKKNIVIDFAEKSNVSSGLINGGFMVFSKEAIEKYFKPRDNLILESEILPKMAKNKQLGVYFHKGYWQSVDTPKELDMLNELWRKNEIPWKIWK